MSKQKVKVVIEKGNCDDNRNIINIDGLIIPNKGIPVTKDFKFSEVISVANVLKEKGVLMAEFEIEDKFLNAYAAICVNVLEKHVDENGNNVIDKCKLIAVGITPIRNADKSISKLSDGIK